MAVSLDGQSQYTMTHRPVDTTQFAAFVQTLNYPSGSVILMDNVAFHKSKIVREAFTAKNYTLLFTPPYFPDANPIENVFSMLKTRFRKQWSANCKSDISNCIPDVISEVRKQLQTDQTIQKMFQRSLLCCRNELDCIIKKPVLQLSEVPSSFHGA